MPCAVLAVFAAPVGPIAVAGSARRTTGAGLRLVSVWCAVMLFTQPAPALAQAEAGEDRGTFRFLASGEWQYGTPLRNAAGAAIFLPTGAGRCEDGICVWPGVQATAHVGAGGWRIGAGPAWGPLFGADILVTAMRTWSAPRGASPDSTYVGVEGGTKMR